MASGYIETVFKSLYDSELDRMHKLDAQTALPVATLTVTAGVFGYYLQNLPAIHWGFLCSSFLLLLCAMFACLVAAGYYLMRSYWGHKYDLVSNPEPLAEYISGLETHYKFFHKSTAEVDHRVDRDLRDLLIQQYRISADFNRRANFLRTHRLQRAMGFIAGAIVALVISMFPFCGLRGEKVQKVIVTAVPTDHNVKLVDFPDIQKVEIKNQVQPPAVQKIEVSNWPVVQEVHVDGQVEIKEKQ